MVMVTHNNAKIKLKLSVSEDKPQMKQIEHYNELDTLVLGTIFVLFRKLLQFLYFTPNI